MSHDARPCPFCSGKPSGDAFPWASRYAGETFRYRRCATCATRYIDPLPTPECFAAMYGTQKYQAEFYEDEGHADYAAIAEALRKRLPAGSRVLDYGCGSGHLLCALKAVGFDASGAEFSGASAAVAAKRSACPVHDLARKEWCIDGPWDAIHLGDVIEHLPDPVATLTELVGLLRSGGVLSAEGPLEANRSPVNAAIHLFGQCKRAVKGDIAGEFPPYHLIFTTAEAQRAMLQGLPQMKEVEWRVAENGWPYRGNGMIKNAIAQVAIGIAALPLVGKGSGNRFRALLTKV